MKSSETDDDNVIGYDINFVLKESNSFIYFHLNSPLSDGLICGTHRERYCIYMLKLYVKFICQNFMSKCSVGVYIWIILMIPQIFFIPSDLYIIEKCELIIKCV